MLLSLLFALWSLVALQGAAFRVQLSKSSELGAGGCHCRVLLQGVAVSAIGCWCRSSAAHKYFLLSGSMLAYFFPKV